MPLPVVVVEVAPPDPAPQLVEQLLEACSEGIRDADCVLADDAAGRRTWGIAIVSWRDPDESRVHIEFGRRGAERWQSRDVRFDPSEPPEERWRTVGFTVGTMAERTVEAERREPHQVSASAASPSDAPPSEQNDNTPRVPDSRGSVVRTTVSLDAGPGLTDGPWRVGPHAHVSLVPRAPLLATASVHHLRSPRARGIAPHWTGFTLGLGLEARLEPVRLELSSEFLAESLTVSFEDEIWEAKGSSWTVGGLGRLSCAWPIQGPIGIAAAAQAWYLSRPTDVSVFGEERGSWPQARWDLLLGVEWRLGSEK